MILILHTQIGERLSGRDWELHLEKMPGAIRMRISRYSRWEDRQAGLFGKLLLAEGLRRCGYPAHLDNLVWDASGRPFLDGDLDLNISHSGDYAVCALGWAARLGVDIEKVRPIDVADFRTQMSQGQWEAIMTAENRIDTFFRFWTQKEAVTKADGRGIAIPLEGIVLDGGKAFLDAAAWDVREVVIADGYRCHLATDSRDPEIRIEGVSFHRAVR
ncbi:MAG: 4'-phosphopantetheinyl transferase superfamily protein [Deltaproteobacteria bacterium]|nr:4'-phosphopantetheinyl transferase superfamily protein [Deltaproteobacteria bacterium]